MQWYLVILGLVLMYSGGIISSIAPVLTLTFGSIIILVGICVFCVGLALESKQEEYYELKLKELKKLKK